ncbi:uncharacterized protein K02A2.6-like [Galleria mellonella]|uniref:RNA-directed DNA polymerase n=1 Tax=Galleria mellonella TaxID=7137 RepID=A0ABM3MYP8_GALME|nr:uncharacterized protein K02A2.6-like [Galleria mellonella]
MEHARPPAELSLDGGPAARSEAWRKWRKMFEIFLKASGVSKEPKEVQAMLRDRVVCGIIDNTVRDRLLRTDDLTLNKAIHICQAAEMSKEESLCIDRTPEVVQVNAVHDKSVARGARPARGSFRSNGRRQRGGGRGRGAASYQQQEQQREARGVCPACGGRCPGGEHCAALYASCYVCDKKGHFARVCVQKKAMRKVLNLSVESASDNSDEEMVFVDTIEEGRKLSLGKLPGKYSIIVDKTIQPVVCPTRKIPLGLKDKLRQELHRMEGLGVIRKVTYPTEWVNAIVPVAKKDGSIRVCLDPRPLNRAVRRAHYTLPTVPELAARLRGAQVFSVLDARCGFWMVEIDEASADLCTFGTPFGRYQFLRLPYGINCAPEVFHAKIRQHLEDLEGVESFIDDVIVWGRNKEEHDCRLKCLLLRARNVGIKFNRQKCQFGVSEITYLGHKFDANGMRADSAKVKAIMEMPYPNDKKALERFLGMINYLAKFIQNYSECVNVLRLLLKKDSEWLWEAQHTEAVDKLKAKLASAPVLALYCERTPVVVSVDASSVALGAVLLQDGRPVEFASLTLTDTQTRYAQIEKEMLAIVFAAERFRQYIYGRSDVTVHTDHKPLETLFNKPLVSVPARLQRMMMRVQGYDFKVVYTPGKYIYIADTLSRAPLKDLMHDRVTDEIEIQTCFVLQHVPFSEEKMKIIRGETKIDNDCRRLMNYITNGWPKNRRDVHENIIGFWPYREQLHCMDYMIFKGDCIFIPRALRDNMVSQVHEGHLGIERCKRRAREVMFWPGMSEDVERAVRGCAACALHAPRPRRQPLLQHTVPALPWRKLASDIFEYKRKNTLF